MNEDDLRSLLTEQVDDLPHNGRRVADVRHRIAVIRRRRAAGVALALVLIALAGAALIDRLPGRPDALPTGVPARPSLQDDGTVDTPGSTTVGRLDWGVRWLPPGVHEIGRKAGPVNTIRQWSDG